MGYSSGHCSKIGYSSGQCIKIGFSSVQCIEIGYSSGHCFKIGNVPKKYRYSQGFSHANPKIGSVSSQMSLGL